LHQAQPPLRLERVVGDLVGHLHQVGRDLAQPALGEAGRDPVLELDDDLLHRRGVEPLEAPGRGHARQRSAPQA
jgi:hypothetical protein